MGLVQEACSMKVLLEEEKMVHSLVLLVIHHHHKILRLIMLNSLRKPLISSLAMPKATPIAPPKGTPRSSSLSIPYAMERSVACNSSNHLTLHPFKLTTVLMNLNGVSTMNMVLSISIHFLVCDCDR